MSQSKAKDPRKTPILGVILEYPQQMSSGVYAAVKVGFRYWCSERNCLQYYGDYDFRVSRFALGHLYIKHAVWGDRPKEDDSPHFTSFPWIRYENLYSLDNADHVKAMGKTLEYFQVKLNEMRWQDPRPQFADYVAEVARLLKIKEAMIEDNTKIPLSEALQYISDISWKTRQRCLVLERNLSPEEYAQKWCDRNGYSDPQQVDGFWWAIPPKQVMAVSIESNLSL